MSSTINEYSFMGGMNRDITKNRFPTNSYYYLENGRILNSDGATTSNIVTLRGNDNAKILDTLYSPTSRVGFVIIGYVTILDNIVLFYAEDNSTSDSVTTTSIIDVLEYQSEDTYQRRECWLGVGMNFRSDKPISAKSNYLQPKLQKIYWLDNNNDSKQANIGVDISGLAANDFEFMGTLRYPKTIKFDGYTSGTLKSGSIMYTYRLIKRDGFKSNFAPVSATIPLGRNIEDAVGPGVTKGDPVYDPDNSYSANKGVKLTLDLAAALSSDSYDILEVASLWCSSDTGVPSVRLFYKQDVSSNNTTINIIDDGTADYGTLDYADVLDVQTPTKGKDLEMKDNRLFISNISENYFDLDAAMLAEGQDVWDARAYRFDNQSTPVCKLYDASYNLESSLDANSDLSLVPAEADCINKYNRITLDKTDAEDNGYEYKFKKDGTTIGGDGLNVSYSFDTEQNYLGVMNSTLPEISSLSSISKYSKGIHKSLQRDEVYRVGIVFFDKYGRSSYVKWVGDVRTPNISDFGDISNSVSTAIFSNVLSLRVEVINRPALEGVKLDYQIVYVKREQSDKTVSYAGIINTAVTTIETSRDYKADYMSRSYVGSNIDDLDSSEVFQMYSPDVNFKKTEFLNADFLHVSGNLSVGTSIPMFKDYKDDPIIEWGATTNTHIEYEGDHDFIYIRRYPNISNPYRDIRINVIKGIKAGIQTTGKTSLQLDNKSYTNYTITQGGGYTISSPQGTCMVYETPATSIGNISFEGVPYAYARQINHDSRFGGQGFYDRVNNNYIVMSDRTSSSSVDCKYGDTFINIYEYCKTEGRTDDEESVSSEHNTEWLQFVCESSVNVLMRNDKVYSDVYQLDAKAPCYMREDAYIDSESGLSFDGFYKYNTAYNNLNRVNIFISKPFDFEENTYHPTRVKYSDVSLGTSDVDPYLIFRTNNYNDANNNYGPLNKLEEFQDKLFAFQDTGVSVISINPRVTQQSEDGVSIVLGSGSVVDSFHYLTTDVGCQDNSDVVKSMSALYWLDKNKKKIYSYGQGMSSVTDMKGMHSYLLNNVTEESIFIGVYDVENSEVLMTVRDSTPNNEFIFNDLGNDIIQVLGSGFDLNNKDFLVHEFVVDNTYKINDSWCRYRGTTISGGLEGFEFEYSKEGLIGNTLTDGDIVDMSMYIQEKDNFTLCFNEKLQKFTNFYSFIPTLYVKNNKGYFSSNDNLALYQHDISDSYNTFYGKYYPLTLTLILNNNNGQGSYTNFNLFAEVVDSKGTYYKNDCLNEVMVKTKDLQSEVVTLYPKSLVEDGSNGVKYIMDTSSTKIGKDFYSPYTSDLDKDSLLHFTDGKLYRSLVDDNLGNPTDNPGDFVEAELCNIRKVIEEWNGLIPRIIPESVEGTHHSNRAKGDYLELTFRFDKPLEPTKKIKVSDIRIQYRDIIY